MSEKSVGQLLIKKRNFFEEILELTLIEQDLPLHQWTEHLEKKHSLLSLIEQVDKELQIHEQTFSNLSHDLHTQLDEMKELIKRILIIDQENLLKRKRDLSLR